MITLEFTKGLKWLRTSNSQSRELWGQANTRLGYLGPQYGTYVDIIQSIQKNILLFSLGLFHWNDYNLSLCTARQ